MRKKVKNALLRLNLNRAKAQAASSDKATTPGAVGMTTKVLLMRSIGLLQTIEPHTIDHEQNHQIHVGHFRSFPKNV